MRVISARVRQLHSPVERQAVRSVTTLQRNTIQSPVIFVELNANTVNWIKQQFDLCIYIVSEKYHLILLRNLKFTYWLQIVYVKTCVTWMPSSSCTDAPSCEWSVTWSVCLPCGGSLVLQSEFWRQFLLNMDWLKFVHSHYSPRFPVFFISFDFSLWSSVKAAVYILTVPDSTEGRLRFGPQDAHRKRNKASLADDCLLVSSDMIHFILKFWNRCFIKYLKF
jgi:hypothetical protein